MSEMSQNKRKILEKISRLFKPPSTGTFEILKSSESHEMFISDA